MTEKTTEVTVQRVGPNYCIYVWAGTKLEAKHHATSLADAYRIAYGY